MNENDLEDIGVEAIIFLQKMAGIDETRESAAAHWTIMTQSQKEQTLEVYATFKVGGTANN
jgi:hypothetical protein